MKRFCALSLLWTLSVVAAENPASGNWKIEGTVVSTPVNQTCTFKQDGSALTGTCVGEDGKSVDIAGEVKDKALTWKFGAEWQGTPLTVAFLGTLETDSLIKGSIDVQPLGVGGTFTATRKP